MMSITDSVPMELVVVDHGHCLALAIRVFGTDVIGHYHFRSCDDGQTFAEEAIDLAQYWLTRSMGWKAICQRLTVEEDTEKKIGLQIALIVRYVEMEGPFDDDPNYCDAIEFFSARQKKNDKTRHRSGRSMDAFIR